MFHVKPSAADRVARYRELLARYHRTLDLMSDRGLADLGRLLEDAERYVQVVRSQLRGGGTVVDVGSGAGLPGMVLAVRLESCRVVLCERRRKRAAFLTLASAQLQLENVEVVEGDVASLEGLGADVVVAQGVGRIAQVVRMTRSVARPGATWVSRRGPDWQAEVAWAEAELGEALAVVAREALGHRGTLVALRLAGGRACPSSA